MSDTKIFSMPTESSNSGMWGVIASLCQQRGLDPNMVAAMMNNNRGNGYGDGAWWWIIILLIFGWGGFGNGFGGGFGGRGTAQGLADLGNLVNNDAGRELLMQAIQGNGNAISQLATTTHCDYTALQGAIASLSQSLCQVGNQVGQSALQVINAIQMGNSTLASQLASCCCDIRSEIAAFKGSTDLQICQQTNALTNSINFVNASVERGFAAEAYERQAQTNAIVQAIANQTTFIGDKFCQLELREAQNKIDTLRTENQSLKFAESQAAQNNFLLSQLQPVPRPAYVVQSPYQSYGYPYGYNGYNNGCGCGCGY